MNSPRCKDLKTVAIEFEKTLLFRADPFRIPRNVYRSCAVFAGFRPSPVSMKKARPSGVKTAYPVGFCPITGSFWPVASI